MKNLIIKIIIKIISNNTINNKKISTIFNEDDDNKNSFEIDNHINDIYDFVILGNKNDYKNSLQNNYSLLTKINEINNKKNYEKSVNQKSW